MNEGFGTVRRLITCDRDIERSSVGDVAALVRIELKTIVIVEAWQAHSEAVGVAAAQQFRGALVNRHGLPAQYRVPPTRLAEEPPKIDRKFKRVLASSTT